MVGQIKRNIARKDRKLLSMGGLLKTIRLTLGLDPTVSDPRRLDELLKPTLEGFLDCYPVSRKVNSVRFDEPAPHVEQNVFPQIWHW